MNLNPVPNLLKRFGLRPLVEEGAEPAAAMMAKAEANLAEAGRIVGREQGLKALLGRDFKSFHQHMGKSKTYKKFLSGEKPIMQLAKMLPQFYFTTPGGIRSKRVALALAGATAAGALGYGIYKGTRKNMDERIRGLIQEQTGHPPVENSINTLQ